MENRKQVAENFVEALAYAALDLQDHLDKLVQPFVPPKSAVAKLDGALRQLEDGLVGMFHPNTAGAGLIDGILDSWRRNLFGLFCRDDIDYEASRHAWILYKGEASPDDQLRAAEFLARRLDFRDLLRIRRWIDRDPIARAEHEEIRLRQPTSTTRTELVKQVLLSWAIYSLGRSLRGTPLIVVEYTQFSCFINQAKVGLNSLLFCNSLLFWLK